ncbi:MAG: pyridoxal-phosphate dependent enzyme [Candidatus Thermoplasmatota archaeon]|nr:pyridoxal-phosphate dependent enzyme [Candidatus Thermoplasmatota archaeon]
MNRCPEKWIPTLKDVQEAACRIEKHVHRTPVLTSRSIDNMLGAELFFKCENLQKVGAFKFRGATNAVMSLSEEEAMNGVATHSSGNHAQALALAARGRGITAYIVMPMNSPKVKVDAVKGYGARVTFCQPTLRSRESTLEEVVSETGAYFIHPYDDPRIIAGQGTAALELLEDAKDLDLIMAPVGGGGLISGTAIASKGVSPGTTVIAAEPERADDAYRSFKTGTLMGPTGFDTIADGLRTSLSQLTFSIIREKVDDIVTVPEEGIVRAMRMIMERMKMIVEPSAAVPLGALLEKRLEVSGKRIGIILSGGNVDLDNLPWSKSGGRKRTKKAPHNEFSTARNRSGPSAGRSSS